MRRASIQHRLGVWIRRSAFYGIQQLTAHTGKPLDSDATARANGRARKRIPKAGLPFILIHQLQRACTGSRCRSKANAPACCCRTANRHSQQRGRFANNTANTGSSIIPKAALE